MIKRNNLIAPVNEGDINIVVSMTKLKTSDA